MSKLDLGLRIIQMLADLGIKPGTFLGKATNVKKAFTGGKPTFFKPDVLETLRAQDGNFSDALKLIEDEAKYITNATDAEKMAFLNNLSQYKSLGGPPKSTGGITALDEAKNLQTSVSELQGLAKTMKDEATKNKNKAWQDVEDFLTTGGQPLKKKDTKFLGGSMHEEGQIRTGVRQFLQTELNAGRLKLNEKDTHRVRNYYPTIEDDVILVFKKIYGDEAYNKAGSFPGAFEKGEDFKHYEQIFRENMGEDILKVKNKENIGDGTLVLDESLTYKEPIDDPDIPFATGGRARYYTGGIADVEPKLDDIGHGSDSLMSRTRLVSPGSQSTTSTGLNYLLAEDNDNIRVPFKSGKLALADAARRKFLKTAGGIGAGIGALKTGLLGFGEKAAPVVEKAVGTIQEAPQYFFDLVAKIKMFGKQSKIDPQERVHEFSYTGKNGDEYTLVEDISTGDAQITKDKMGGVRVSEDEMTDGIVDRSVMEYKSGKGMADESTKGTPPDEYDEYKVEFDQDGTQAGSDILDESVQKEIIEETADTVTKKAEGGRIGFSGGKLALGQKIGKEILDLLKDKKKLKAAWDNIFPSGDYKYDAEMVAESLVENNPKQFNNMLYEDLPDNLRSEVYGAALTESSTNFAKQLNLKRAMDKASKPTKTLEGIKKTGTINISDPEVAEEFSRFMKETDPEGSKVVEQTVELSNFNPKGRKKNAFGGLTSLLGE